MLWGTPPHPPARASTLQPSPRYRRSDVLACGRPSLVRYYAHTEQVPLNLNAYYYNAVCRGEVAGARIFRDWQGSSAIEQGTHNVFTLWPEHRLAVRTRDLKSRMKRFRNCNRGVPSDVGGRLHLGIRFCSGIFLSVCPIAVPASRFALPRVGVPAFRLTTRSEFSRNEE